MWGEGTAKHRPGIDVRGHGEAETELTPHRGPTTPLAASPLSRPGTVDEHVHNETVAAPGSHRQRSPTLLEAKKTKCQVVSAAWFLISTPPLPGWGTQPDPELSGPRGSSAGDVTAHTEPSGTSQPYTFPGPYTGPSVCK